nr:MAG TPA: hypothetical protein [Caudoviricetes sp.]
MKEPLLTSLNAPLSRGATLVGNVQAPWDVHPSSSLCGL